MENKAITVNIPRWETDSLELICGIANAGGGYVLLPTSQKDYSSGLRRARRKFESIPDSITQGLGLTCPITPVMEGNEFFLEIDVPAALEPLGLHGVYWLYEDGVNTTPPRFCCVRIPPASCRAPRCTSSPSRSTDHRRGSKTR